MRFLIFAISFLFAMNIFSQVEKTVEVKINLSFGKEKLQAEKWYALSEKDSFLVDNLKFYLSGIEFIRNDKFFYLEKNSFHLVDFLDSNSTKFKLEIPNKLSFSSVKMNLGIDSLTNSSGVQGGALDPTTGMYWTWQSGYINFKLEGKSNLCETRNNAFTFHLGGFSSENNALQVLQFQLISQNKIEINLDIQKFLTSIDLKTQNHIMSPSKEAVGLAKKLASLFSTK